MADGERAVLISIRPHFANAILSAQKTVELRRTKINAAVGTCFLIYSTSPVMAVIGTAVLERMETDSPARLWVRVKHSAHVSRDEYIAYFEGATEAVALHLSEPELWKEAVPLEQLRSVAGVEPNQSFRYLNVDQVELIAPAAVTV